MQRSLRRDELHRRLQRRLYKEHHVYLDLVNVRRLMQMAFDEMAYVLAGGRRAGASVEIRGFGTFTTVMRAARRYRRPGDHHPVQMPAYRRLVFRPAREMRLALGRPRAAEVVSCE